MEYNQNDMLHYYSRNSIFPVHKVVFQYATGNLEEKAALNFHLTKRELKNIRLSVMSEVNTAGYKKVAAMLK